MLGVELAHLLLQVLPLGHQALLALVVDARPELISRTLQVTNNSLPNLLRSLPLLHDELLLLLEEVHLH